MNDYKNVNLLNNIDNKVIDINTDFNELKKLLQDTLIIDDKYYSCDNITEILSEIDKLENNIKNLSISCSISNMNG